MEQTTVIRDVGKSLIKLFKDNINQLSNEKSIVFDSPGDMQESENAKLSAFLYQVTPNVHFRNIEPIPIDTNKMRNPPVTLDLSYIFTPYAKDREDEILVLERLIQLLHDNAVFRGDSLLGDLQASGNNEIRIIPTSLSPDDLHKLWGVFPNKSFKLSVAYILTPVIVPSSKDFDIYRVVEKDLRFYSIGEEK